MDETRLVQYIAYAFLAVILVWIFVGWFMGSHAIKEGMANRKKTTDPRGANVADLESNLKSDSKLLQDMLAVKDNKVAWEDLVISMEDVSKKEMLSTVYSIANDIKEGKSFSAMSDKIERINRLSKFVSASLPNCMTYVDSQ